MAFMKTVFAICYIKIMDVSFFYANKYFITTQRARSSSCARRWQNWTPRVLRSSFQVGRKCDDGAEGDGGRGWF